MFFPGEQRRGAGAVTGGDARGETVPGRRGGGGEAGGGELGMGGRGGRCRVSPRRWKTFHTRGWGASRPRRVSPAATFRTSCHALLGRARPPWPPSSRAASDPTGRDAGPPVFCRVPVAAALPAASGFCGVERPPWPPWPRRGLDRGTTQRGPPQRAPPPSSFSSGSVRLAMLMPTPPTQTPELPETCAPLRPSPEHDTRPVTESKAVS